MIRGTSQQFKFELPYQYEQLTEAKIAFWQENNQGTQDYELPILKNLDDCVPNGSGTAMYVTLNSKETLAFECDRKAFVQLWASTANNSFGSREKQFTVYPMNSVLLEGVADGGEG
jgi:hypothetical protein